MSPSSRAWCRSIMRAWRSVMTVPIPATQKLSLPTFERPSPLSTSNRRTFWSGTLLAVCTIFGVLLRTPSLNFEGTEASCWCDSVSDEFEPILQTTYRRYWAARPAGHLASTPRTKRSRRAYAGYFRISASRWCAAGRPDGPCCSRYRVEVGVHVIVLGTRPSYYRTLIAESEELSRLTTPSPPHEALGDLPLTVPSAPDAWRRLRSCSQARPGCRLA